MSSRESRSSPSDATQPRHHGGHCGHGGQLSSASSVSSVMASDSAMFSSRVPSVLRRNRLTEAIEVRRAAGQPVVDLTLSNPTHAGFDYPPDLLAPLADARAPGYDPQPFGSAPARRAASRGYRGHGRRAPGGRGLGAR